MASTQLELLAPAGDMEALQAALQAGADAVYFGLTALNARRGASNFTQEQFVEAVRLVHEKNARAYLTLNIDLTDRELGQAARTLELARQCQVDAVLVRDPALLALKKHYSDLAFHFSTQTCVASSADVAAAGELGAQRVVLAREMSLEEMAAASAVPGVETEVFVQGALCFSISGRCLLSSWAGGRSGNRGLCTSPCRVPWTAGGSPAGTPLSMRDLATPHRVEDLARAGVKSLKIEGRLKTARWVEKAVKLYRRALAGESPETLEKEAADLGAYTGRQMTCGYLDAQRDSLTAVATGRTSPSPATAGEGRGEGLPPSPMGEGRGEGTPSSPSGTYDLDITIDDKGIRCRCTIGDYHSDWTLPRTVVRRAHKAVSVADLFARLGRYAIKDYRLGKATSNDPAFLLVPRVANGFDEHIAVAVRVSQKEPDEQIHIDLPADVRKAIEQGAASKDNDRVLGEHPDRARVSAGALAAFLKSVRSSGHADLRPEGVIVEHLSAEGLHKAQIACSDTQLIVALPAVFFEAEIAGLRELLAACRNADLAVEVNNWGGWHLAREFGLRMEAGPGMGVLNSLAASALAERGMSCVTLSIEADRKQLESLSAHCPVATSLVVFGRPALMTTRVQLPKTYLGQTLEDRREVQLTARLEHGVWVLRPPEPFDLRTTFNDRLRVRHLVADLVASPDPAGEWLRTPPPGTRNFRFNYDRTLA